MAQVQFGCVVYAAAATSLAAVSSSSRMHINTALRLLLRFHSSPPGFLALRLERTRQCAGGQMEDGKVRVSEQLDFLHTRLSLLNGAEP